MNIYAQAGLTVRIYSRVSKQAGAFRVHSTFRTCYRRFFFVKFNILQEIEWKMCEEGADTAQSSRSLPATLSQATSSV